VAERGHADALLGHERAHVRRPHAPAPDKAEDDGLVRRISAWLRDGFRLDRKYLQRRQAGGGAGSADHIAARETVVSQIHEMSPGSSSCLRNDCPRTRRPPAVIERPNPKSGTSVDAPLFCESRTGAGYRVTAARASRAFST